MFVADHISIPADARRMEMTDKDRYQKIREDLGRFCGIVELSRVQEGEAVRWIGEYCLTREVKIDADGARELVDALGGDMMMVSNELEKLILYAGEKKKITLADVETMVLAAKQRSLYELTDAISAKDRARALEVLDALLSTGDGEEAAIGHLYMLAKTFRQMLVIRERNVRDQRMLVGGLVAGLSRAAVCRRRYHPPGAALQIEAGTDSLHSPGRESRSGAALESSRQTADPRKTGSGSRRRAQA